MTISIINLHPPLTNHSNLEASPSFAQTTPLQPSTNNTNTLKKTQNLLKSNNPPNTSILLKLKQFIKNALLLIPKNQPTPNQKPPTLTRYAIDTCKYYWQHASTPKKILICTLLACLIATSLTAIALAPPLPATILGGACLLGLPATALILTNKGLDLRRQHRHEAAHEYAEARHLFGMDQPNLYIHQSN